MTSDGKLNGVQLTMYEYICPELGSKLDYNLSPSELYNLNTPKNLTPDQLAYGIQRFKDLVLSDNSVNKQENDAPGSIDYREFEKVAVALMQKMGPQYLYQVKSHHLKGQEIFTVADAITILSDHKADGINRTYVQGTDVERMTAGLKVSSTDPQPCPMEAPTPGLPDSVNVKPAVVPAKGMPR